MFAVLALFLLCTQDPTQADVFSSGDGLYPSYRIPAILTTDAGTVLAFAEGRATASDHAENDIVLCRSLDGGESWSPVTVLHDDGANSLNNPCVMQVESGVHAGRILLMYQRYPEGCHESCVVAGLVGPSICRGFLLTSDDDGVSWSVPREITAEVKRPTGATSIAGGPGVGIQKRHAPNVGRILFPFNQGPGPNWKVYAVFSDDGGDTWTYGDVADDSQSPGVGNEVQFVELSNGDVYLNSRSNGGAHERKVATSSDGGQTWSALLDDPELIEPQVMASVWRLTDPADGYVLKRMLYAGPDSSSSRVDGTVRISYDDGDTWPVERLLYPGAYAYSVLTSLPDGRIGVLFERDGYAHITLARFDLAWLTGTGDAALPGPHATSYCATAPNSVGSGAHITSAGSANISVGDFKLTAGTVAAGEPAIFYYGPAPIMTPFGAHWRCVGGGPGELVRIAPPVVSDILGGLYTDVPLDGLPHAGRLVPASTWYFQCWYRDPGGATGSGLTDGLQVTFAP